MGRFGLDSWDTMVWDEQDEGLLVRSKSLENRWFGECAGEGLCLSGQRRRRLAVPLCSDAYLFAVCVRVCVCWTRVPCARQQSLYSTPSALPSLRGHYRGVPAPRQESQTTRACPPLLPACLCPVVADSKEGSPARPARQLGSARDNSEARLSPVPTGDRRGVGEDHETQRRNESKGFGKCESERIHIIALLEVDKMGRRYRILIFVCPELQRIE